MSDRPDLRDLLPDDVEPDELERLGLVHDLLLAAGRPAELPPRLAGVPAARRSGPIGFAEHRRKAIVLAAAAAAAVLIGIGFFSGWSTKDAGFKAAFGPVTMRGGPTSQAVAQIWVGPKDAALNWPSLMKVRGLPTLPQGVYYTLYLTDEKTGKRLLLCSAFAVHAGVTTVTFNFPGPVEGRGWVVVREPPGAAGNDSPVLWTPQPGTGTA